MDIKERLGKVRFFPVKPDLSALSDKERRALRHCVRAAKIMTDIYLRQVAHGNFEMYRAISLRSDAEGKDLARYFGVQGSPWDQYVRNEPFVPGVGPRPKFGSFYPRDFTKEEWNAWLAAHPEDRERFESSYTAIDRRGNALIAFPYAKIYKVSLRKAANELWSAAKELPKGNLQSFLKLRAESFFNSNDYFSSDLSWVDTTGDPFEVTIGPYEVYFDELLGLKAAFTAFIGLPDKDATAALAKFIPVIPDFDRILSGEFNFKPKDAVTPLEVVADVYRGGEAAFGYRFIAYSLPNDRRVHEIKGSKKVFSSTMMRAKFEALNRPIAERILAPEDMEYFNFHARMLFVLAHELSHGLGPSMVRNGDRAVPFEVKLGDLHSCIEEAKADMLGVRLLGYFRERGIIDDATVAGCIISEVSGWMQSFRHGYVEAHAKGNLMQYNWLAEYGAMHYDAKSGVFRIDSNRSLEKMILLSAEYLNLQSAGDYDRAKTFIDRWTVVPPELHSIVERLQDIPLEVAPVYDVRDLI